MAFEKLEGRVLTGISYSRSADAMRLEFLAHEPHYVNVEGDCCSHSYWHEVLGAKGCYGGYVTGAEVLSMPEPEQDGHECLQAYGYALNTTRGKVVFAFRNESNGYYGGWANDRESINAADWVAIDSNDWVA